MFGYTLHIIIMLFLKNAIGRLRPSFISMCVPDWTAIGVDCAHAPPDTTIDQAHCTASHEWEMQGRSSFPSGHSSAATFFCVFTVLYVTEMSELVRFVIASRSMLAAGSTLDITGEVPLPPLLTVSGDVADLERDHAARRVRIATWPNTIADEPLPAPRHRAVRRLLGGRGGREPRV